MLAVSRSDQRLAEYGGEITRSKSTDMAKLADKDSDWPNTKEKLLDQEVLV